MISTPCSPPPPPRRGPIPHVMVLAFFAPLLLVATACPNTPPAYDSGPQVRRLLPIASPLQLGLKPGQTRLLEVRYETAFGLPVGAEVVTFAIFGDPRGTTLSGDTIITDDRGHARIELRAGAAEAAFEVHVTAKNAPALIFSVQISKAGFASLTVYLRYVGVLLTPQQLSRVDLRLFSGRRCATFDPTDTSTPLRHTVVTSILQPVSFPSLPVDRDHALLTVAFDEKSRLRAWACLEIPASLTEEAHHLTLTQALDDASPLLAGRYEITSQLTLPKANRPLAAALAPWRALTRCPNDPAQRLLDCILDALDPNDPLDCVIDNPSPPTLALMAERGALIQGCRGDTTPRGATTIDRRLGEIMNKQGKNALTALSDIEARAQKVFETFELHSILELTSMTPEGQLLAAHRLVDVSFPRENTHTLYTLAKIASKAPAGAVAIGAMLRSWRLEIHRHALSLRPGLLLRTSLADEFLTPAKLPRSSQGLVRTLADFIRSTTPEGRHVHGCAAIGQLACTAARLPSTCLESACEKGILALAARLDAGFLALDTHSDADLILAGDAPVVDSNGRLRVDRIGAFPPSSPDTPGRWTTAHLHLANEIIELEGATFRGILTSGGGK